MTDLPTEPHDPENVPHRVLRACLRRSAEVVVYLDPRRAGVQVPDACRNQYRLVLLLGLNLANPIRDLVIDTQGFACTLSFNGTLHSVVVPWAAVYAVIGVVDGQGSVWPARAPVEEIATALSIPRGGAPDTPRTESNVVDFRAAKQRILTQRALRGGGPSGGVA